MSTFLANLGFRIDETLLLFPSELSKISILECVFLFGKTAM